MIDLEGASSSFDLQPVAIKAMTTRAMAIHFIFLMHNLHSGVSSNGMTA